MPTLETGRSMAAVGALIAAGYVCGLSYPFNISDYFWKVLVGVKLTIYDVYKIDSAFEHLTTLLKTTPYDNGEELQAQFHLNFAITDLYRKQRCELIPNGKTVPITVASIPLFIEIANELMLNELSDSVQELLKVFYQIITLEILNNFSPTDIQILCCGSTNIITGQ